MSYDLEANFSTHPPTGDKPLRYAHIRNTGRMLAGEILKQVPESRERSLALTNVEQAVFWANAAIARYDEPESPADALT